VARHQLPVALLLAAVLSSCGQTTMVMSPMPATGVLAPVRLAASAVEAPAAVATASAPGAQATVASASAPAAPPPANVPAESPAPAGPPLHLPTPANVRAIYSTGWTAGSPASLQRLMTYVQQNGLNAMVIDIKDNDGRLSFALPGTEAQSMGADGAKIADPVSMLQHLHAAGIYVIGRIVTFADPWLATHRPDWAIHTPDGGLWHDPNGNAWIDPKSQAVWTYNIQIGQAAAKLGFDEIQFDYIRLPEERIAGYNIGNAPADREAPVDAFLTQAVRQITSVPVSGDVFAIDAVATSPEDQYIGQDYTQIAHILPVISPMAYPSLYAPGEFGIPNPNARPYDTIWQTLASAEARAADLPRASIRPWIQDFNLGAPAYGPAQVNAELQALAAAGIHSFMMWNAGNVYTDGVDFGLVSRTPLLVPDPAWLAAAHSLLPSGVPVWLPAKIPGSQAYSVTSTADAHSYAAVLWGTPLALPANDPTAQAGQPLLEVSGARTLADLAPLPAMITTEPAGAGHAVQLANGAMATASPAGAGFVLTWQRGGMAFQVWAPDLALATAAGSSMQQVQLVEGR